MVDVLKGKFNVYDLGTIKNYVGLEITKVPEGYKISLRSKIAQLLKQYNLEQCNGAKTSMTLEYEKNDTNSPIFDADIYRSLVGSLMYISNWSRLNIAISCNLLARMSSQPTQKNWLAAKRILRYLKQTIDLTLYLIPTENMELTAFVVASFASDTTTRQSTSGLTVFLAGSLMGWKSTTQRNIALSTCEAEFSALSGLCTELVWYKQLLKDLGIHVVKPIKVYEDNQGLRWRTASNVCYRSGYNFLIY